MSIFKSEVISYRTSKTELVNKLLQLYEEKEITFIQLLSVRLSRSTPSRMTHKTPIFDIFSWSCKFSSWFLFSFFYVFVFNLQVCLCTTYITVIHREKKRMEDVRLPVSGITDGHETLCRYWKLNLGSLEEKPVILTSENSLQPIKPILE